MFKKNIFPYLSLMAGITALSMSAMFVRWADAPGTITGFYRLLFSSILFVPFFIYKKNNLPSLTKEIWIYPIFGGLFTAFDFAFWNTAVQFTTAANATLLGNTAPVWVVLFSFLFLREELTKSFWVGLALAMLGAVLVMGSDFLLHPTLGLGDLLACGAAIFYAAYQLVTQQSRKKIDSFLYIWLVSSSAAVFSMAINITLGHSFFGYSGETWVIFLATAVVSQMIGYLCVSHALGYLPAYVVAPTLVVQPILTTLLAVPLLGEYPSTLQWCGGTLALAGVYLVNQAYRKAHPK